MATASKTPRVPPLEFAPIDGDQCVVMHGLDWRGYSLMLRLKGGRTYPKMVYLDGSLWQMSPSFYHELIRTRSGLFVYEVVVGLGIRCVPAAATTFRRRKRKGGFEADQSYYFANHPPKLRKKGHVDLREEQPPDLTIEVVYTHAIDATLETCRRLGVREVWACDERSFRILVLDPSGRYVERPTSASLPFLAIEDIEGWLRKEYDEDDETRWGAELRDWVRDVLAPRARGAGNP